MATKAQLEERVRALEAELAENQRLLEETARRVPPLGIHDLNLIHGGHPRSERGIRPWTCWQISGQIAFSDGSYYDVLATLRNRPEHADIVALTEGIGEYIADTMHCGPMVSHGVQLSMCRAEWW